ncbi:MAG: hypothetical protein ACXABY_09815 [Candidatus Thorarchaeota archaeon]|jgi:hypothetical protein
MENKNKTTQKPEDRWQGEGEKGAHLCATCRHGILVKIKSKADADENWKEEYKDHINCHCSHPGISSRHATGQINSSAEIYGHVIDCQGYEKDV